MIHSVISKTRVAARNVAKSRFHVSQRAKSSPLVEPAAATAESASSSSGSVPVGYSMAAALAGVTAVSVTAAAVEMSTADSCLPYSTNGQRFDQNSFQGRFLRMLLACDPRLLLYSESEVRQAQSLISRAQEFQNDRSMDRTLWEARRIADAALHPDTGDVIPRPFRMSGYVPYNGPICVAMVASTSTLPLLFWSWVNQSQNALVNYYNRNASSPMSNETLLASYSAAVGSALTVAFGLATFIQRRYPAAQAKQMMKYVAFPSAVVASSLNCYIVRSPEIETGVPLMDENGHLILNGEITSNEAAKQGVHSTTVSRAILQAPVYFLPPILLTATPLAGIVAKHPIMRVPITTFLVLTSFGLGLPATTAIFPQITSISADDVEPQFQNLQNPKTGAPYTTYYYNKGL